MALGHEGRAPRLVAARAQRGPPPGPAWPRRLDRPRASCMRGARNFPPAGPVVRPIARVAVRSSLLQADMSFAPAPPFDHDRAPRVGVLLVNLGTPDAPTPGAVRRYLAEFLSDPRVVEIPRALWLLILHGVILRVRPAKSAAKYALIWTKDGSPLLVHSAEAAFAAAGAISASGRRRWGCRPTSCAGRARDALRQPVDRRRARQARRRRLRPHPRGAALPAVRREHDRLGARCGVRLDAHGAPDARAAHGRRVPRRSRATSARSRRHQRLLDEARAAGQAGAVVPRRAAALARPGRPVPLPMPQDGAPAGRRAGAREVAVRADVPVALRPGRVAEALYRGDARRAAGGGGRARRRLLSRLRRRLPGDARGDRDRRQSDVPRGRRARIPRDSLRQRAPAWIAALADLVLAELSGWLAPPPDAAAREATLQRAKALGATR